MNKKCFVNINGGEDVIVVNIFDKSDKIITGHQCHHDTTRQTRPDPDPSYPDNRCHGGFTGSNLAKIVQAKTELQECKRDCFGESVLVNNCILQIIFHRSIFCAPQCLNVPLSNIICIVLGAEIWNEDDMVAITKGCIQIKRRKTINYGNKKIGINSFFIICGPIPPSPERQIFEQHILQAYKFN